MSASVAMASREEEDRSAMKMRLCRFHRLGRCLFGSSCRFAHGFAELRSPLGCYKTKLCEAFARGQCLNAECNFAHSEAELRKRRTTRHSQASSSSQPLDGIVTPESPAGCGFGGLGLFTDVVYSSNSETGHGQASEIEAIPQRTPQLTSHMAYAPEQAQSRDVGALAEALPLLGASQGSTPPMPRMLRQPCLAAPMSLAAAPLRESAHSEIVQARDVHGHAAEDNLFTYTMPPDRPVPTHHVVIEDYFMSGDQSGSCFATQLTNSCSSGPTQVPRLNSGGDATDLCEDSWMDGSLDYMLPFQTPCAAPQHPATSSPLAAQQSPIVFPAATEAGLRKCWTVRHSQASSEGRDAVGGLTSPGQWLESQARCGLGGMGLFTDTVYRLNSETEHGQTKELDATPQLAPHLTRCTAFAPEVSQSRNVVGLAEVMTSSGTSQKSAAMLGDSIRSQITQAKSADGCAAEDNFVAHAGALQKPTPGHASNRGQQGSCLATQQMEAGCMPSSCIETLASLQRQTSYASTCGQVWTSPPSSAPRQVAVPSIDNEIAEFFEDVLIQNSAQDSTSNPQHLFAAPQQGTICNPPMNMAWAQQVPVAFPAPEEATACIHTGACCSALPLELQGMGSLECMPRPQMSGMWREQTGVSGEAVQVSTASRTGAVIAMSSSRLS